LVLLHTVRTQAEHFRHLIPLVQQRYTVYALDLPGMGYSQIVPGASYDEPAMRAAVKSLITQLDLRDVTLLGESMGATLALTTAAICASECGVSWRSMPMTTRAASRGPASWPGSS
jgi:pimeloyl-ACP methyl ester carboxylesterase